MSDGFSESDNDTNPGECSDSNGATVLSYDDALTMSKIKSSLHFSTPLYPGAQTTILQALVEYFTWFTTNRGITKSALSSILHLEHESALPKGNLLPASYEVVSSPDPTLEEGKGSGDLGQKAWSS